ncbi:MAG TPA: 3-phosphoshikimate 1-carboxyvinyltransferase [Pyrinomonadaceae bacterium]
MSMRIEPARRIRGRLRLPGDKSISHRAAIISALARGQSRLTNFSTSEDCAATLRCLRELGVAIERDGAGILVEGTGSQGCCSLRAPSVALDCGNSGSTMRMLAGVLAGQEFDSELTGDDSLRSRPMSRIIEPLEMMGARVASDRGRAPLRVSGRKPLEPIRYEMAVASAQVKSCILLAGLNAEGRTVVIEKQGSTRDHTERMLRWFGVPVETFSEEHDGAWPDVVAVDGLKALAARDVAIPGDISSAAFFIAAAALLPGSRLEISDVGLNPTRAQILRLLQSLGARVSVREMREHSGETVGDVQISAGAGLSPAKPGESNVLRGALVPQLIDELPLLAVVGTQVEGGMTIRDAAELRVKESDRISATVENLRAMGAEVEEYADGLAVAGRQQLRAAMLDARGDHRIGMAFTVAALIADGASEIKGARECVGVSFPEFYRLLADISER